MLERILETTDTEELRALALHAFRSVPPEQRLGLLAQEAGRCPCSSCRKPSRCKECTR